MLESMFNHLYLFKYMIYFTDPRLIGHMGYGNSSWIMLKIFVSRLSDTGFLELL